MSPAVTLLFDRPQSEIAATLRERLDRSVSTRIVSGFATADGLETVMDPIRSRPQAIETIVLGAATYPGLEALDNIIASGVQRSNVFIHLGHTHHTGGRRNPFARYHPMLHSKIYYMSLPGHSACAVIGSHNLTSFALSGLNGEASVLLEGPEDEQEFERVRSHIDEARRQAVSYDPAMKEAYAWWSREYLEGVKAEVRIPTDWQIVRTVLMLAQAHSNQRPVTGDEIYFELPDDIFIDSLRTEAHLFLFSALPPNPQEALYSVDQAEARYKCRVVGVEADRGNQEIRAQWRIAGSSPASLVSVPNSTLRPTPANGYEQVRAVVEEPNVQKYEYSFERDSAVWLPELSPNPDLQLKAPTTEHVGWRDVEAERKAFELQLDARTVDYRDIPLSLPSNKISTYSLVTGLKRTSTSEKDALALLKATPESGSFILVSVRRRKPGKPTGEPTF